MMVGTMKEPSKEKGDIGQSRATISLDFDVRSQVGALCETWGLSLNKGVNRILRRGLGLPDPMEWEQNTEENFSE